MGFKPTPGAGGSDPNAIHTNVAGEIQALTEKNPPVSADLIVIEDSAASYAKKKVQVGNLPTSGGGGGGSSLGRWSLFADEVITWDGDAAGMSLVSITGNESILEGVHSLSVAYQDQASNDLNCLLTPHTFSIGDTFVVPVRNWQTVVQNFAMAALVFSDGITAGSNAVAVIAYHQGSGGSLVHLWGGTLTAMNAVSSATIPWGPQVLSLGDVYLRLGYSAANTFQGAFGPDGLNFPLGNSVAHTLTPTHYGVGWSAWGGTNDNQRVNTFGPIRKTA